MLQTGYLGIWEPATLAIKREGYNIKYGGSSGVVVTEKFSPNTSVCFLGFSGCCHYECPDTRNFRHNDYLCYLEF